MNRWINLLIIGLLAGCSTSSEPDDPNVPANVDTSGVPAQKHYDSTVPFNFAITDLDGLKSLNVQYIENGNVVWSENNASGNSFKKSWLPSSQGPTDARLEWEYSDAHSETERGSGSLEIDILDTRFAEGSLNVAGRFGGSPDGYLTVSTPEKKKVSSIEINDGVVNYDRTHKIDADSLQLGKYVRLVEAPGYATQRARMSEKDIGIVPWNAKDWDYNEVLGHMMEPDNVFADQGAVRVNERWRNGSEIEVSLYDEQYFDECESGLCAYDSDDENLLAEKKYLDNSRSAYSLIGQLLPNIDVKIKLQSESEESFRQEVNGANNIIFIAGWPGAQYSITHANGTQDGAIIGAFAMQQTDPVSHTDSGGRELSDGIESFGIKTTGQGQTTIDYNNVALRPLGKNMLLFRYDRPIGTGHYEGVGVPGKDGPVDVVHDYIPD